MDDQVLPVRIAGLNVYMVGIKGTGMAALAEILVARGAIVGGSDVAEVFYTDALLRNVGIDYYEGFAADHLRSADPRPDLVVYSAAYAPDAHPELLEARRLGIPMMLYPEALGALSRRQDSVGIAGVHGKTTTAAMVACMVDELGLEGTVLAGSALPNLGGRATLVRGDSFFIAETCEYRRNFLSFSPRAILITSVEPDHLDYFTDGADIEAAFVEYGSRLGRGGTLVYCADDPGATRVASAVSAARSDVTLVAYGFSAQGPGAVRVVDRRAGTLAVTIGGYDINLHIPGDHNALNAAGAALVVRLVNTWNDEPLSEQRLVSGLARAIAGFHGTRRRSELVGEAGGVLIVDDYAHHPTAIATTLAGFRSFYPDRRIVLSFMSHTYSRTLALLDDFARALSAADVLVLHDIYASAREENPGGIDGEVLSVAAHRYAEQVHYVPGVLDAAPLLERILRPGDLFVTMGAGNNWELGLLMRDRLSVEVAR
ncbi:MAG: UDP-N-acetylmuramate--L-alanine ligase [Spirochaetota bacterium]